MNFNFEQPFDIKPDLECKSFFYILKESEPHISPETNEIWHLQRFGITSQKDNKRYHNHKSSYLYWEPYVKIYFNHDLDLEKTIERDFDVWVKSHKSYKSNSQYTLSPELQKEEQDFLENLAKKYNGTIEYIQNQTNIQKEVEVPLIQTLDGLQHRNEIKLPCTLIDGQFVSSRRKANNYKPRKRKLTQFIIDLFDRPDLQHLLNKLVPISEKAERMIQNALEKNKFTLNKY